MIQPIELIQAIELIQPMQLKQHIQLIQQNVMQLIQQNLIQLIQQNLIQQIQLIQPMQSLINFDCFCLRQLDQTSVCSQWKLDGVSQEPEAYQMAEQGSQI